MSSPTYTKEEALSLIKGATEVDELETLRQILKEEKKRYPLSDLVVIGNAFKARVKAIARRDAAQAKALAILFGFGSFFGLDKE